MKLPRDMDASTLVQSLTKLGYKISTISGSHIRLTTKRNGEHHLTVPNHDPIRVGTLSAILREVEKHHLLSREQIVKILFQ